jgi:site-specific recombinase XerD
VPLGEVERGHIQAWLAALHGRVSGSTAATYFRAARVFFRWAEKNELIGSNPMAHCEAPKIASKLGRVIPDADLAALARACNGKTYQDRRDMALLRILAECGLRAAELAALTLDDIDIFNDVILVRHGKGDKERLVPFGPRTGAAISAALRARPVHAGQHGGAPAWVGANRGARSGALTRDGVHQIVKARCAQAGIHASGPHDFRHTAVSGFFKAGGSRRDSMEIFGWSTEAMAILYGKEASGRVALTHWQALGLGDNF